MSSGSGVLKSVKLPLFDDVASKFQVWWTRFRAYAAVFGFVTALTNGGDPRMPATENSIIDENTDTGKGQADAKQKNAVAMANLTMALTGEGSMSIIYEAMNSDKWPTGLAWVVIAALMKKFMPNDGMSSVEMRQQLDKVSMKRNDNPEVLFEQLSRIKNQFVSATVKLSEADQIAVVLGKAPKEYKSVLTNLQVVLRSGLTLEDMSTAMNLHWRSITAGEDNVIGSGNELVLSAFSGMCYKCKKPGHKTYECPLKKTGDSNHQNGGS